jgi:hypothetical protein
VQKMEHNMNYKETKLEKLKIGMIIRRRDDVHIDYITRMAEYEVNAYVWSQDAGKKVEFKYPADWWQAVKERFSPKWFTKKYPVVYITKTFIVKATYPDLNIQACEPVLRLIETTDNPFWLR